MPNRTERSSAVSDRRTICAEHNWAGRRIGCRFERLWNTPASGRQLNNGGYAVKLRMKDSSNFAGFGTFLPRRHRHALSGRFNAHPM